MHPLKQLQGEDYKKGAEELCGSRSRHKQIAQIGMDADTAEERYYKDGHKGIPFEERKALFWFLYILKHNPGFNNAKWQTHADDCNRTVWEQFWTCLDYFLEHTNELDFEGRLNKHNHSPLFPYVVTLIGDCFPVASTGGTISNVLFQPKHEDKVYKLLLFIDHLGQYQWVGGLVCSMQSDIQIVKELGP